MVLRPLRAALLSLGAALFLVAGCQAPGHQATAPAPPDPRPLDGVLAYSERDERALWTAEENAVRACMRARGHTYRTGEEPGDRRIAGDSPFALLRPEAARGDGYGLTSELLAGPPPDPNAGHLASLTPQQEERWRVALLGELKNHREITLPDGLVVSHDPASCVSRAQAEVYGEQWQELYYAMQQLSNGIIQATQESAPFRRAQRAWGRCMKERGHQYRTLEEPRQEIRALLAKAGPGDDPALRAAGARELDLAKDDLACQLDTGLHAAVRDAEAEAGPALVEASKAEVERYGEAREAALSALGRQASPPPG
ncbi:hypothetical protein ACFVDU_30390 [Streptomyces albidoflavus]